jgi:hypothetical protein
MFFMFLLTFEAVSGGYAVDSTLSKSVQLGFIPGFAVDNQSPAIKDHISCPGHSINAICITYESILHPLQ